MNITQSQLRFYVETRRMLGDTAAAIHTDLCKVWGEDQFGFSTVRRHMKEMRDGRESMEDNQKHSGRKRTSRTISNIEKAAEIVSENQRITVEELADELEIQ